MIILSYLKSPETTGEQSEIRNRDEITFERKLL
jgi:hypothetical protein